MSDVFAIWCRDKADRSEVRSALAKAHLDHVEAHIDRYLIAGPLKEGGVTTGSLLVVKASNAQDARSFLAQDPYHDADIWETIEIKPFVAAAGDWVGGAAWKNRG